MPPPLNEEAASWYRAGSACCLLFAAYSVGGGKLPLPGIPKVKRINPRKVIHEISRRKDWPKDAGSRKLNE
jgi:hypothetical protein